jgi:hypothetical protein
MLPFRRPRLKHGRSIRTRDARTTRPHYATEFPIALTAKGSVKIRGASSAALKQATL